ncbi:MAG: FKBP-type peptidyl-prolyl cis-trans isomerase, partial [Candidatus Omnitrophota bacterium]
MKPEKTMTKNEPYGYGSELSSSAELEVSIIQWQGPRYNVWLKTVAMIVVGVFLCQQVVWAGDIKDILPDNKQDGETPMQTLGETEEAQKRQQELLEEQAVIEPEIEKTTEEETIAPPITEEPLEQPPAVEEQEAVTEGAAETAVPETVKEEGAKEEDAQEIAEKVYEEIGKEIQKTELEEKDGIGQKIVDAIITFLGKVRNSAGENYARFRELLNIYNPQILGQDGFDALVSYLRNQAGNIFNCASFALDAVLDFANDARVAATAIILDILNGILVPTAQGILKTSLFALREIAAALKNITLYALQITIDQLRNLAAPVIAHIQNVHYVVVTKVTDAVVEYLDNTGRVFTESIQNFLNKWDGIILAREKAEGAKELSEAEQKNIRGAGFEPADFGFATGSTGTGTAAADTADVYGDSEYSIVLEGNDSADSVTYAEKTITLTGAAQISFAWKVSSESNYDYLKFYIDDVMQEDEISGETNWAVVTYDLEAGEHILRWEYVKDGSVSYGDDAGWVSEVIISEAPALTPSDNTTLTYEDSGGNIYTLDYYENTDGSLYRSKYNEAGELIGYRILYTDGTAEDYDADWNLVDTAQYAREGDTVSVKYTGYLTDGSIFDSNEDSEELFEFAVGSGGVIEGFDEAVMGLMLGEKITVTIPPEKAYGTTGTSALAGETLIFDITLVEINGGANTVTYEETPEEAALNAAKGDLARLLGLTTYDEFALIGATSIEAVTWPDSALGWQADENTIVGDVAGYSIILTYNGTSYEYHTGIDAVAALDPAAAALIAGEVTLPVDEDLIKASEGSTIGVIYTGYLTDGTVFDSNVDSGALFEFTVGSGQAIEGFDEGVVDMSLGSRRLLIIPPEKAYGLAGESTNSLAGQTLIFEVQVMEINGEKYNAAMQEPTEQEKADITSLTKEELANLLGIPLDSELYQGITLESLRKVLWADQSIGWPAELAADILYTFDFDAGTLLEDSGFTIVSTGDAYVSLDSDTTYDYSSYAMRLYGNDSQGSLTYAEKTVTLDEAGQISFLWKVSSENNYDYLKFYIDGVEQDGIAGDVDWAEQTYDLAAGEHTLRWEYSKDAIYTEGDDCGWVDDISISKKASAVETEGYKVILTYEGKDYEFHTTIKPDETTEPEIVINPDTASEINNEKNSVILSAENELAGFFDIPSWETIFSDEGLYYSIEVRSIERVRWDNSALGWQADENTTEGGVEGYKIILMYNGRTYEYHAATDGAAVLDPEVKKNILAEKAIRDRELKRRSVRPSAGRSILNDMPSRSSDLDDTLDANGNGILDYLEHSLVRHLVDEIDMILADTKTSQSEYEKALYEQDKRTRERESAPDNAAPSPREEEPLPEITGGALTSEELDDAQDKIASYKNSIEELQNKEIDAASKEEALEGLLNEYEAIFSSLPEGHNFTHVSFESLSFDNTPLTTAIEKATEAISVLEENIASKDHEAIADNVIKDVPEINEANNGLDDYINSLNGRLAQLEAQIDAINDYLGVKEAQRQALITEITQKAQDLQAIEDLISAEYQKFLSRVRLNADETAVDILDEEGNAIFTTDDAALVYYAKLIEILGAVLPPPERPEGVDDLGLASFASILLQTDPL